MICPHQPPRLRRALMTTSCGRLAVTGLCRDGHRQAEWEGGRGPDVSWCLQSLRETEVLACVYVFVCLTVCEACECICMHVCACEHMYM